MKSRIIKEEDSKKITFPLIAQDKHDFNLIVLFTSETSGTILMSRNDQNPIGMYSNIFVNCIYGGTWKILDKLTIEFY